MLGWLVFVAAEGGRGTSFGHYVRVGEHGVDDLALRELLRLGEGCGEGDIAGPEGQDGRSESHFGESLYGKCPIRAFESLK
jgi:hypothetical protein